MYVTEAGYEAIAWEDVESSNIRRVAWNQTGTDAIEGFPVGQVCVEFGSSPGRAYRYGYVPEALYKDLLGSESVGGFFARNIRGRFDSEKIEIEPDE